MQCRISVLLVTLLLSVSSAHAQSGSQPGDAQARDLNRQALDAYAQLEVDRADQLLANALAACDAQGCSPAERARTLVNQAIVAYGGRGDAARAVDLFTQAATIDPTIRLDPMHSSPDIDMLFQRGRTEAENATGGGSRLRHTPPREQLVHTPLPLYIEIPDDFHASRVEVRYQGNGMRRFATLAMQAMVDGFGVEVACQHVFEPSLAYYFVAFDAQNRTIGTLGSEASPFVVNIVARRSHPAPSLPSRAPPEACNLDECPPDLDCSTEPTSRSGTSGSASGTEDEGRTMRFWAEVGPALTMASGRSGLEAASPPNVAPGTDPQTDADPSNDSYYQGGTHGCDLPSDEYCVRVTSSGTAFAWGLQLGVGAWFTDRVGVSLHARVAPQAGAGTLSRVLLGARFQYRLIVPRPRGFHLAAHLGLSVGQVQVRPKQVATTPGGSIDRPWAQTGIGGAQLGVTAGYRFTDNIGMFVTPELFALFPSSSFGLNVVAGLDFAFGARGGAAEVEEEEVVEAPRPGDRDRDQILDTLDQCPDQPEDRDQFTDEDGCPDLDDDMDTIPDTADACRLEPEDMDGYEDTNGCPDPDNDGDGITDNDDRCPVEPGVAANHGCPDPDRDGDTVPDRVDNCPDEAGPAENHGCRVQQRVVIEGDRLEILEKVFFRTNSHVIDRRSYPLLDNIAAVIVAHPEIGIVAIEGHTDARGNAARNRALSTRRANSVRTYLLQHGVDASRITAEGFGPDRPMVPNATTDAEHEANRRVEFRLVARP